MRPLRSRRDEHGAVTVIVAICTSAFLIAIASLTVDLGNTWARRGQLQIQADYAAMYAADFLPATTASARTSVAKAAAFYFACHTVRGQRELTSSIPTCPDSATSSSLDAYAAQLIGTGAVTFPDTNEVSVTTPPARIDFGFAPAAVDSQGRRRTNSVQTKTANARIGSPGVVEPMALSLDCLLNGGANVLGGAGLPFGYFSSPHVANGPDRTDWPDTSVQPTSNQLKATGITPSTTTIASPAATVTVQGDGNDWPTVLNGASKKVWVSFALGEGASRTLVTTGPVLGTLAATTGSVTVALPAEVRSTPGPWAVKVATGPLVGQPTLWSSQDVSFTVNAGISLSGDLSCGRLLKSPRANQEGTGRNFALNTSEGLDHPVTTYPNLISVSGPTTEAGLLSTLSSINRCNNSGLDVKDTNGSLQTGKVPNCMVMLMSGDIDDDWTDGLIGPAGRLTCSADRPCTRQFLLGGRQINNDTFDDFVTRRNLLTSSTFFNASTYLTPGIPVVTPNSALSSQIYASHRFMWVPVLSTPQTGNSAAGSYPVLTFRPVFITQASGLANIPQPPLVANTLSTVDAAMRALLQGGTDRNGLVMKGDEVAAARFLTIEPAALPAVPADYDGPVSDYFGVGPKLVRLVR